MTTLPFVVAPRRKPIIERIGDEDSGIIEIERRGYLTTGEKSFVQQVQQFDNGTGEIVTTSRRVARTFGLGMDKAYTLILGIISAQGANEQDIELVNRIEQEFAEDLTAIVRGLSSGQVREELVFAACLIKYRIDQEFDINDIAKIHPEIISGLAKLYREEDAKSLEAFQQDKPVEKVSAEEAEKKPVKATKSPSKNTTGD